MQVARIFEAYALLIIADLLAWHSTKSLYRVLRGASALPVPWHLSTTTACVEAVAEASVWYVHSVACLQRSAALTLMLRFRGIPADLVIGFQPSPFRSHAWVELDGAVVNDRPQYQRFFTVLDRV